MAALRQQVKAFVDANLAPAARSKRLAALAREMRDGLIKSGRASAKYETFVDGRQGAPEDAVRGTGGGSILYLFSYQAEAVVFALAFLRERSPAKSGKFRDSFFVSVDGRFIPSGQFSAKSLQPGAEVIIGNTQPYNRKVDVQLVGRKTLHFSTPAGLYDDCARALKRQFRGAIDARRVYSIQFPGQYQLKNLGRYKHKPGNRGGKVQSPAIIISTIE